MCQLPLRVWSNIIIRLFRWNRQNDLVAPPPLLQTCSEVGEERDEFSPITNKNLPKEVRPSFFFFFFFFFCFLTICVLFTYVQIFSIYWSIGGSAEQPQPDPDGKALSQPKPHPSSKTG